MEMQFECINNHQKGCVSNKRLPAWHRTLWEKKISIIECGHCGDNYAAVHLYSCDLFYFVHEYFNKP